MKEEWARDRVALVTGATSGFGEAFTRRILRAGGRVIATGRREERLGRLADEMDTDRLATRALDLRPPPRNRGSPVGFASRVPTD